MSKEVVIVSAARTPIGSFLGSLSSIPATKLGATAIKGALDKINLKPELVQEVLMGNVVQANNGQAPARQAALGAGIPDSVPCTTVNKVCASGMNGLVDAYNQEAMGTCADLCATEHKFSREDQDEFAIESYKRSAKAWEDGKFDDEVVPVEVPQRRGEPILVSRDEEFENIKLDKIPKLRPAFSKDGTATAANSSTINDGAGAMVLMSREKAEELDLKVLATVAAYADAAQEPKWFTTAPAKALPLALDKANVSIKDVDYFEFNEAFSVVGLANMKILGLSNKNVNVNGGAVSLGHPLGCSGVRILITLLNVLQQNDAKVGAAAICNGGGGASAMVLKR